MDKLFARAYCDHDQIRASEPGEPIRFAISTEGIKRDGKNLNAADWNFENYRKNPVVLWVHDYFGRNLPIGRADVGQDGEITFADVEFDPQDEFAMEVEGKYRRGYLNAVSVGWDDIEIDGEEKLDLLDISAVPVPGDPDALIERQIRALEPYREAMEIDGQESVFNIENIVADLIKNGEWYRYKEAANEIRKSIKPHTTDKLDDEAEWDGANELSKAEGRDQLTRMHSWNDPNQDPDTKQAYQLAHHQNTGEVVWRGVAAAMGRLFQANTKIPESDRRGVYNHLARHYEQFDKTPPEYLSIDELMALEPDDIRGLFLEGEFETETTGAEQLAALQLINLSLRKLED